MSFCKYHPLDAAQYLCPQCNTSLCSTCIDEGDRGDKLNCVLCDYELEVQALGDGVGTPFWRRLQESFRYPLNWNSGILIAAFALISTVIGHIPIFFIATIVLYLSMLGGMLKYCFACLEHTSMGEMDPPDITEAYGGGLGTIGAILVMIIFMVGVVLFVERIAGGATASLAAVIMIMGFPAMLINYATSGSLNSAINLGNMFRLITTIGPPYGLIIAFVMIMTSSVAVLHEIVGDHLPFLSSFLKYAITWYYMIVTFHIMGYMIYQYQARLGFVAQSSQDHQEARSDLERTLAMINVYLKEGQKEKASRLFKGAVTQYPQDTALNQRYFDFLVKTRQGDALAPFAEHYLKQQLNLKRYDKMGALYKQVLSLCPAYKPEDPALRLYIARASLKSGDSQVAARLLSGLHKSHPDFSQLVEAYEVLHEALLHIPELSAQAPKCEALLRSLRARQINRPAARNGKAQFGASDLSANTVSNTNKANESNTENKAKDSLAPLEFEQGGTSETKQLENKDDEPKDLPPIEFKP